MILTFFFKKGYHFKDGLPSKSKDLYRKKLQTAVNLSGRAEGSVVERV